MTGRMQAQPASRLDSSASDFAFPFDAAGRARGGPVTTHIAEVLPLRCSPAACPSPREPLLSDWSLPIAFCRQRFFFRGSQNATLRGITVNVHPSISKASHHIEPSATKYFGHKLNIASHIGNPPPPTSKQKPRCRQLRLTPTSHHQPHRAGDTCCTHVAKMRSRSSFQNGGQQQAGD